MSEFRINGILQASYKYDAMGRQAIRTLTWPSPVTIHSVFDSQGRRIAEYNETTGALIREYIWLGWEPVAVIEGSAIFHIRTDHIGRPVFATSRAFNQSSSPGVVVWSATYTPFGGVTTSTGTPITARFPGQWFQSESGLHQNWMRDYDPTTGRYLEADPLGLIDGASVYGYAGQSPIMNADPSGQCFGPAIIVCPEIIAGVVLLSLYLACPDDLDLAFGWLFPTTPGPGHNGGPPLDDSGSRGPGPGGPGAGPGGGWPPGFGPLVAIGAGIVGVGITNHGQERIAGPNATRGGVLSYSDAIATVTKGIRMVQTNGMVAYVNSTAAGKFNVVVMGVQGIHTTLGPVAFRAVTRLAYKHGWRL
jgi:RHS repeat-associated protein